MTAVSVDAAVLEVAGLTVGYGGRPVLEGVSLSLRAGEMVGLVGPNGSGKTTLLRAIGGVLDPRSGEVRHAGAHLRELPVRERALRIAAVPQIAETPPAFTALELVLMGRTPHLKLLQGEGPADLDAARRAMTATDTWHLAERRLGELSGGERQLLLVARALAQETPLLLLDEPTAHLDIGHQATVLRLMRRLCRERRKAVLAAVHDLTLAAQFCPRLVMLHRGHVVAEGPPGEVLTPDRLRHVYGADVHILRHPVTGRPVLAPDGDQE